MIKQVIIDRVETDYRFCLKDAECPACKKQGDYDIYFTLHDKSLDMNSLIQLVRSWAPALACTECGAKLQFGISDGCQFVYGKGW